MSHQLRCQYPGGGTVRRIAYQVKIVNEVDYHWL